MAKLGVDPAAHRRRPRRRLGGAGRAGADGDAPPRHRQPVRAAQGTDARQGDHRDALQAFVRRLAIPAEERERLLAMTPRELRRPGRGAGAARGRRRRRRRRARARRRMTTSFLDTLARRRARQRLDALRRPRPRPGALSRAAARRPGADLRLLRRRSSTRPATWSSPSSRRSPTSPRNRAEDAARAADRPHPPQRAGGAGDPRRQARRHGLDRRAVRARGCSTATAPTR